MKIFSVPADFETKSIEKYARINEGKKAQSLKKHTAN